MQTENKRRWQQPARGWTLEIKRDGSSQCGRCGGKKRGKNHKIKNRKIQNMLKPNQAHPARKIWQLTTEANYLWIRGGVLLNHTSIRATKVLRLIFQFEMFERFEKIEIWLENQNWSFNIWRDFLSHSLISPAFSMYPWFRNLNFTKWIHLGSNSRFSNSLKADSSQKNGILRKISYMIKIAKAMQALVLAGLQCRQKLEY